MYNTSSSKTFCPNTANEYHIWFNCLPISPESHIIVISSNSSLQSEGIWWLCLQEDPQVLHFHSVIDKGHTQFSLYMRYSSALVDMLPFASSLLDLLSWEVYTPNSAVYSSNAVNIHKTIKVQKVQMKTWYVHSIWNTTVQLSWSCRINLVFQRQKHYCSDCEYSSFYLRHTEISIWRDLWSDCLLLVECRALHDSYKFVENDKNVFDNLCSVVQWITHYCASDQLK